MKQVLSISLAFLFGLVFTWLSRYFARKLGVVNQPNNLVPQHVKPVAYLGGIGIFFGILLTCLSVAFIESVLIPSWFLGMCFLYLLLGLVDDLVEMKPLSKFASQFFLAGLAVWGGISFPFTQLYLIDFGLSVFWILILVNASNLTDVCDGLVGGLSVIIFLWICLIGIDQNMIALIAAGATLGFLVFNSPPASIFMGDAGSHLLGFIVAYLSLTTFSISELVFGFFPLALLSGVFLFELIFLIVTRQKKGLKWWLGSSDHFSLRLQAIGKSKWQTDLIAWGMGLFCGMPLVVVVYKDNSILFFGLTICLVLGMFAYFWWYLIKQEKKMPDKNYRSVV